VVDVVPGQRERFAFAHSDRRRDHPERFEPVTFGDGGEPRIPFEVEDVAVLVLSPRGALTTWRRCGLQVPIVGVRKRTAQHDPDVTARAHRSPGALELRSMS
jgi:hypothetical protein